MIIFGKYLCKKSENSNFSEPFRTYYEADGRAITGSFDKTVFCCFKFVKQINH